ncbi:DHA2 family efflux MFS transporter permease subunit [Actinosynnema pretiosum]|uniref:MFS transporter n=1 Tax=Actinosynnema pretiosum TaxID=42197 RepID=A0A290Z620_9PSEU|nr:DHA2 family efflux MFS transporter permease subunit [Actinosynnema pretiosum]ATE54501.1 MFS transporter [Actinosynnema pretiosum]
MHKLKGNPWAVLATLCLGFFMTLLDTTVVGVAMPDIVGRLGATYNEVLWVSNAYVLVLAVLLITGGRLGDLLGKRNTYLGGVLVFTVASLLCALSQDAGQLIAARVLQGVGAALLVPQTMSIIITVFPAHRRGAALGVWGAVAGVATIAGPPLGGLLVTSFDWRWIFTVNVPIGAAVLLLAPLVIPATPGPPRAGAFDLRGAVLVTLGLSCLAYGLQEGQRYGWGTVWSFVSIPLLLALGVALLALFALVERSPGGRQPLVPFALFRARDFALMNAGAVGLSVGIMSMAIGFQLYAQSVLGMSALAAGAASAPMSVASILLGPVAGRMADRIGGRALVVTGLLLFAAGLVLFGMTTGVDSRVWSFLPSTVVIGAGLGLVFAPLTATAMREVSPVMAGAASGVLNATRQLGSVLGTAGFGVLLQNRLVDALGRGAEQEAAGLPPELREPFLDGVARAAASGVRFDELQAGSAVRLPDGASPEVAERLAGATRHVFSTGFVEAMHSSLALPVAALLVAAGCCLFAGGRGGSGRPEPVPVEASARERGAGAGEAPAMAG